MKKITDYMYDQSQQLGSGSYGHVYLGIHIKTKNKVAVKVVSLEKFPEAHRKRMLDNFRNQITNMQLAEGRNIVRLLAIQASEKNLYLVCEYCNGGNLQAYIQKMHRLTQKESLKIFRDILNGMKILHSNNIVHRDLKPANVMLNNYTAKVGDFGFSKLTEDHDQLLISLVGTPQYMSPQILSQNKYTDKTDIWSLGIILYEMLYGRRPWQNKFTKDIDEIKNIRTQQLRFPEVPAVSPSTKHLIKRMLELQQNDRINWQELFEVGLKQSQVSEQAVKDKIQQIVSGHTESDVKINHYSKLYFELNKVIKSTYHFEENSNYNMQFVSNLMSVKSKLSHNSGIEEEMKKEANIRKNKALLEKITQQILSRRNSAVVLVSLYFQIANAISSQLIAPGALVTAVQMLLLKQASIELFVLFKLFKGNGVLEGIEVSDWHIFCEYQQKQTLTTLSKYDSSIINLLFGSFLNSINLGQFNSQEQKLITSRILPLANQHFDQSGQIKQLLNTYLKQMLKHICLECSKSQPQVGLLKLGNFILVCLQNEQLKMGSYYYETDFYKLYQQMDKIQIGRLKAKLSAHL